MELKKSLDTKHANNSFTYSSFPSLKTDDGSMITSSREKMKLFVNSFTTDFTRKHIAYVANRD